MAHFARIQDGKVTEVIVVKNCAIGGCVGSSDPDFIEFPEQHTECGSLNFPDTEPIGQAFLTGIMGGEWLQTSYNGNFRGQFAGQGMTYDPVLDEFVG